MWLTLHYYKYLYRLIIQIYLIKSINMFDISSFPIQKKLFYYMHHSLKKSKCIKERAIFLIGQIRAGKSTTFNWITNPKILLGQTFNLQTRYTLTKKEGSIAHVNQQYQSVTMIPNIEAIIDNKVQSSLIDFPGFHDSRTSAQRMMVNYVINTCFSHCSEVKFIMVVSDVQFRNTNGHAFINTIKQFAKFFRNFPLEERMKLYKSTSLLITSAQIIHYDSSKQMYLNALKENMQKIKNMNLKNEQFFHIIEELINSIIADKRMELFKVAIADKSPSESTLLASLNNCGWDYYNLKPHRQRIVYPYQQYFQHLLQSQQEDINMLIISKVRKFQNLQTTMAHAINTHLQNPFNRVIDLTENFIELKKIVEANRIHEDILIFQHDLQNNQDENVVQLNPIKIFNNISALYDLTFSILLDQQRPAEQRQKIHYFQYLRKLFQKSINLFNQSLALKEQYKQIMVAINQIFSQLFEQLIYITKINRSLLSSCTQILKQSILIMNRSYLQYQIPSFYINSLLKQNFQDKQSHQYSQPQLCQIISFLDGLDWKQYEIKAKFILKAQLYNIKAKILFDQHQYMQSVKNVIDAFDNILRYKICLQHKKEEIKKEEMQKYQTLLQKITKNIYLSTYYIDKKVKYHFQNFGLLFIIQMFLQDIENHENKNNVHQSLLDFAKFYEEKEIYSNAAIVYKKLLASLHVKRSKIRSQQTQQKIKICLAKSQLKVEDQSQNILDMDTLINLFNLINQQILKNEITFDKAKIREEIINHFLIKSVNIQRNQFQYDISSNPSYSEIIAVSQSLILKIKQRKVILMLGQKSGNTTAFYWLQSKQIISRKIRKNQYIYDCADKNIDKIHHKNTDTSFIPNIAELNEGQILIDFTRLFQKKIINALIQLNLLRLIIQNSKEIKFLIVIKEVNLLNNQLVNIIQFLVNTLSWEEKNLAQNNSLALLINFSSSPTISLQKLSTFLEQFSKNYKNQELFQELYGIDIKKQAPFSECLLKIKNSNKILYLPQANDKKLQKFNCKQLTKEINWNYLQTANIYRNNINYSLNMLLSIDKQRENVSKFILSQEKKGKALINKLGIIFESVVNSTIIDKPYQSLQINQQQSINLSINSVKNIQNSSQLFILNQMSAFYELINYNYSVPYPVTSIRELKQIIFGFIGIMKKMSFHQKELLKCLYYIQEQFKDILIFIEKVDDSKLFGYQISGIRHHFGDHICYKLRDCIYKNLHFSLVALIKQFNIELLVKQLLEVKINPIKHLLQLIQYCEITNLLLHEIKKYKSIELQRQKENINQKYKLALIQCKEICVNNKEYSDAIHHLITLFQFQYKSQKDDEISSYQKIELIKIFKEIALIMTNIDQVLAFSICDVINCDQVRCNIYDRLISIKQNKQQKLQVLVKYLYFVQKIGWKQKFMQLCEVHKKMQSSQQRKSIYQQRYNKILSNQLQLNNIKQTFYDYASYISTYQLQEKVQEIKKYLNQKKPF